MAANTVLVELEFSPLKKVSIKTTPLMSLKQILTSACEKLNLNPDLYQLKYQRNILDLSLSMRFANLPSGAKLLLVKSKDKADNAVSLVTIALQLDDGTRQIDKLPSTTKLWDVLLHFEKKSNGSLILTKKTGVPAADKINNAGDFFKAVSDLSKKKQPVYMMPVLSVMNNEFNTIPQLKLKSLSEAGLSSGNGVLRLGFKYTEHSLEHFLPQIEDSSTSPFPKRTASLVPDPVPSPQSKSKSPSVEEHKVSTSPISAPVAEPETKASESTTKEVTAKMDVDTPESEEFTRSGDTEETEASFSRDIRMYLPPPEDLEGATKIDLPDSFFELSASELKLLVQNQKFKREYDENRPLMTKALREREAELKRKKWPKTLIRVRFPDRTTLQATFFSHEPVSELYSVIRSALDGSHDFKLFVTPPMRTISDDSKSFWEMQLAPQSVVYIKWPENAERGSWTPEYISKLEDYPLPSMDIDTDAKLPGSEKAAAVASAVLNSGSSNWGGGHRLDETRERQEDRGSSKKSETAETSGKVPAWFKLGTGKK